MPTTDILTQFEFLYWLRDGALAILLHRAGHPMGDVGFLDFVDATEGRSTTP